MFKNVFLYSPLCLDSATLFYAWNCVVVLVIHDCIQDVLEDWRLRVTVSGHCSFDSPSVEAAFHSGCVSKMFLYFLLQCGRLKRWLLGWVRSVSVSWRCCQCQALMSRTVWIICCDAFWSVKCQTKVKNAHLKFLDPEIYSLNCFFGSTKSPKLLFF